MPEDFAPERVPGEAVAERISSVMKMISEDMYSTTVDVPVLTVEVYSRYERGEVLENLRIYHASSDGLTSSVSVERGSQDYVSGSDLDCGVRRATGTTCP